jgi:hypothetical protein
MYYVVDFLKTVFDIEFSKCNNLPGWFDYNQGRLSIFKHYYNYYFLNESK